jgi:hypothetical protein
MRRVLLWANKLTSLDAATTVLFHAEHLRRRVPECESWAR